jgi:hypothetical protein
MFMTIEQNLGNIERVLRLFTGIALAIWAFSQPALNGIEWLITIAAIALMLNGVFGRCYLWYVLDLNTCQRADNSCEGPHTCP